MQEESLHVEGLTNYKQGSVWEEINSITDLKYVDNINEENVGANIYISKDVLKTKRASVAFGSL